MTHLSGLMPLEALAGRLSAVEARLERAAVRAEAGGALSVLTGLAGQQIHSMAGTNQQASWYA